MLATREPDLGSPGEVVPDAVPVACHASLPPAFHVCALVHGAALWVLLHHGILRSHAAGHHGAGRTGTRWAKGRVSLLTHPCRRTEMCYQP